MTWINIIQAKKDQAVSCKVTISNLPGEWPIVTIKTVGMHHNNHIITYDHIIYPESIDPITAIRASSWDGEKNDIYAAIYGYM
jgi:hypothetical protein